MVDDIHHYKLVIFDLDGTLADTFGDIAEAVNFALAGQGLSPFSSQKVRQYVGNGVRNLMERLLSQYGKKEQMAKNGRLVDEAVRLWKDYYQSHPADHTTLYKGACKVLEGLRQRRVKTAVLTNKDQVITLRVLDALGIKDLFDCIVGENQRLPRKPAPEAVRFIMQEVGATPKDTLIIGDGEADILAGKRSGCSVWGVSYGVLHPEKMRELGIRRVVDSLEEIG